MVGEEKMNEKMTPNRSKTYLLPLLNEFIQLPQDLNHLFINTYVNDSQDEFENCLFLLYHYDIKNPKFTKFEYELSKKEGFLTHIDLKDNQIIFIFKFPEEFIYEYNLFKNGKYSRFRHDCKALIINYWNSKLSQGAINRLKQIFDRSDNLRKELERTLGIKLSSEDELSEGYNDIKETINITEKSINYL